MALLKKQATFAALWCLGCSTLVWGAPLLTTGDFIIAIDRDTLLSGSNSPGNEGPANSTDGNTATKYLNFAKENSGVIVTPFGGATTVQSIQLTTANDAEPRDPASFALYGTTDAITSTNHSLGDQENWTLIATADLALPAARVTAGPVVSFANSTAYTSYKITFPTLKNTDGANSMQVAEIALFQSANGSGPNVLLNPAVVLAIDTDELYGTFVAAESPPLALDNDGASRYRNAGGANSGFIVTPWSGPSIVTSFEITTAFDNTQQDPSGWELYGTNDPITSPENSQGEQEDWTLIGSGSLDLPLARVVSAPVVELTNTTAYRSYKMVFTGVREGLATTPMHIGDIQFHGTFVEEQPDALLRPGDFIIAIDRDTTLVSSSNYPAGEPPANAVDNNVTTKYLNFGETDSGFIITPAFGPSVVRSIVVTTANDAVERDPTSFALFGTNEAIASVNNSFGNAEAWTLIATGNLELPETRQTAGPAVGFTNETSYASYRIVFPTVKNSAAANSMQVAEVALYESSDGTGANVLGSGGPILAIDFDSTPTSSFPAGESPPNAIDGTTAKYLNFGQANSGFIVTPSLGGTTVRALRIITANDAVERDPMTFELFGTNDPITSESNSQGTKENWMLIASGELQPPLSRWVSSPLVEFPNDVMYTSYKVIFPTVRTPAVANSMQVTEIQFYGVVGVPCPEPFADGDEDGDVDQEDFALFQSCITGGEVPVLPDACRCFDADGDVSIDQDDLLQFQRCVTGPEIPWTADLTPECTP